MRASSSTPANRICLLTTSFPRSREDEASVFLARLVEGYSECGAEGIVVVPRDRSEPKRERFERFEIQRFGYGLFSRGRLAFGAGIMPNVRANRLLLLQAPALLFQLIRHAILDRKHYDFVHANWTPALIAAWVASWFTRKPYIVTLRGEDMKLVGAPVLGTLAKAALAKAHAIVSVNQSFLEDFGVTQHLNPSRVRIIPNGVSPMRVEESAVRALLEQQKLNDCPYLLFVGSVIPRKRIEVLFELLRLPVFEHHRLVVCGRMEDRGYLALLQQRIAESKLERRVQFEGAVPPALVPAYVAGAAAYVSASAFEGRPNAVLEALSAGKLVLVSDIPAHREIVRDQENGLLFDVVFAADLESKIRRFLPENLPGNEMRKAAQSGVSGQTWKTCAEQYLSIFK